jgi:hypothetical protein
MNGPLPAIFPASLLSLARRWRAIGENLPKGTFLLVLPPKPGPTWDILFGLAADLENHGAMVDLRHSRTSR